MLLILEAAMLAWLDSDVMGPSTVNMPALETYLSRGPFWLKWLPSVLEDLPSVLCVLLSAMSKDMDVDFPKVQTDDSQDAWRTALCREGPPGSAWTRRTSAARPPLIASSGWPSALFSSQDGWDFGGVGGVLF